VLRRVKQDVDLSADICREIGDGFFIRNIERHDLDALQAPARRPRRGTLPGIGHATKTVVAPAAFRAATASWPTALRRWSREFA